MSKQLISLLIAALVAAPALAGGDAAKGKEKSAVCGACHGADGNSPTDAFPRLGGQQEDYLYHSLMAYKSGKRKNAIMGPQAANLTKEDMADLAAYFSSQDAGLMVKK